MQNTGIYTITNIVNGKVYVGSAVVSFRKRKTQHYSDLKKGKHVNKHLQRAYNKYGESNLVFEILEYQPIELCLSLEKYWINLLDSKNSEKGYNINDPLAGRLGIKHSNESKLKMREAQLGEKSHMFGKKLSEEHKRILAENARNRVYSKEDRIKISQHLKGKFKGKKNPFYGKKHSEETIELIKSKIDYTTRYKKIAKYDLNWNLLEEYSSLNEAKLKNNISSNGSLCTALKNPNRSCKGFKWKYI